MAKTTASLAEMVTRERVIIDTIVTKVEGIISVARDSHRTARVEIARNVPILRDIITAKAENNALIVRDITTETREKEDTTVRNARMATARTTTIVTTTIITETARNVLIPRVTATMPKAENNVPTARVTITTDSKEEDTAVRKGMDITVREDTIAREDITITIVLSVRVPPIMIRMRNTARRSRLNTRTY